VEAICDARGAFVIRQPVVEELKPEIDRRFRTSPGRDDTMVLGSSMGGLTPEIT